MGKKKSIEVKQQNQFIYIFDKQTFFTQRKKALISRDPLTKELLKKLDEFRPNKSKPSEEEIETIRQRLADKWNVGIIVTGAAKPFVTGLPVIKNHTKTDCLSPVKFSYDGTTIQEMEPLIIINNIAWNPVESFYPFTTGILRESKVGTIELCINLNLLDQNDAAEIKQAVWSIIKKHLPKNKPKGKVVDIKELSFIYDEKQETFNNYIQWYDWHINELLGFRVIAFLKKEIEKGNTDVKDLINKLQNKQFPIGTRKSYKGEDNVEKGIKLIYEAIHRKKYPAKKDRHETFLDDDCPVHSPNKCPVSCKHWGKLYDKFNKLIPEKIKSPHTVPYNDERDYS